MPPSRRRLVVGVFAPNLLLATGQGGVVPVLALAARSLRASPVEASVIVAMSAFGTLLFDIPAGWVIARLGEHRAWWVSGITLLAGLVVTVASRTPLELGLGVFVAGCGWSIWLLARLTYLARTVPAAVRGRTLAVLGATMRAGTITGPFLLVALASSNDARLAFVIDLACSAVGFVWLLLTLDRNDTHATMAFPSRFRPAGLIGEKRKDFATASIGAFAISLLRAARRVVVPLWGAHLGLDVRSVSLIFGISSIVDLAGFYPAGVISDRFGRVAIAVPCLLGLSLGYGLLPLAHGYDTLLIVAILLATANGLGSGVVMTLGADRAPPEGRAGFLAIWRVVSDLGSVSGPLLVGAVIALASLAIAGPVLAVVGVGGAVVIGGYLTEPPRALAATTLPCRPEPEPGTSDKS